MELRLVDNWLNGMSSSPDFKKSMESKNCLWQLSIKFVFFLNYRIKNLKIVCCDTKLKSRKNTRMTPNSGFWCFHQRLTRRTKEIMIVDDENFFYDFWWDHLLDSWFINLYFIHYNIKKKQVIKILKLTKK